MSSSSTIVPHKFTPNTFVIEVSKVHAAQYLSGGDGQEGVEKDISSALDLARFCEEAITDLRGLVREAFARLNISNPLGLDISRHVLELSPFTDDEEAEHDEKTSGGTRRRDQVRRFHVLVVDTRIASALYHILIRVQVVPLQNMRLMLPNGGAILDLPDSSKMNFDDDLWKQVDTTVARELKRSTTSSTALDDSATATLALKDVVTVAHVAQWSAKNVQHCGIFEVDGTASSLAVALFLLHRVHPTLSDLAQLGKHHNRCVRCVALFYARYVVPPEELLAVFLASLTDQTLVSTSAAGHDTISLKDLCRQLLVDDEVFEAWLPQYPPVVLERLVPAITREAEHLFSLRQHHNNHPASAAAAAPSSGSADSLLIRGDDPTLLLAKGPASAGDESVMKAASALSAADSAKGHGSLPGFRSLRAFRETFAARRRHALRDVYDVGFGEDDEEAEYRRRLQQQTEQQGANITSQQEAGGGDAKKRPREVSATNEREQEAAAPSSSFIDTHKMALSHGSKVLLKLLGRTAPFRKDDPVYLEF